MTNLYHREGNLFHTDARAIGHGVNTLGLMDAGIAVQFKAMFPDMYLAYKAACETGNFKGGMVFPWSLTSTWQRNAYVMNIASQEKPGRNASYDFLVQGVTSSLAFCEGGEIDRLALPRLGSGIGGLDMDVVEGILGSLAARYKTDIELWTYKP